MEKSSNISLGKGLTCEKTGQRGKTFLSSSCFSFQLTLITLLWWERVIYFCLLNKTIYFPYLLFQMQKGTNRPFVLLPWWHSIWTCQSGVQKHDLLRAWGRKKQSRLPAPWKGLHNRGWLKPSSGNKVLQEKATSTFVQSTNVCKF